MPKCNTCSDTRIVSVIDAEPPYRPCPDCTPSNINVQQEIIEEEKKHQKERDARWGNWINGIIVVLLNIFFWYDALCNHFQNLNISLIGCGIWIFLALLISFKHHRKYKEWL